MPNNHLTDCGPIHPTTQPSASLPGQSRSGHTQLTPLPDSSSFPLLAFFPSPSVTSSLPDLSPAKPHPQALEYFLSWVQDCFQPYSVSLSPPHPHPSGFSNHKEIMSWKYTTNCAVCIQQSPSAAHIETITFSTYVPVVILTCHLHL